MSGESLCACAEPLSFEDALAVETGLDAACRCDPRTCGGGGYSSDTPMVMQAGIRALAASLRTGAPLLRLGPSDHAAGLSAVDVERRALEALVLALVADGDEVGAVQAREELVSLTDVQEEGSRSVVVSGFALRSVGEQLLAVVSRDGADTTCCQATPEADDGPIRVRAGEFGAGVRSWDVSLLLGTLRGMLLVGPVRVQGAAEPTYQGASLQTRSEDPRRGS
ncbi:hypothetical protein [Nocardioides scoriae]|uniref:hypothetical protein n=1 Tax=Nocardioides scoriae TaxID=642780 RepID=UPI000B8165B3|nr:hypothetical protein [Nocardioides scoriae]